MGNSQKQRLILILIGALILGGALYLSIDAMRDKVSLFKSPQEILAMSQDEKISRTIRLGGLVAEGSVKTASQGGFYFTVSDFEADIKVYYNGLLPDLFREGQGVYVDGSFSKDGKMFIATEVLAKHDENYKPPLPGEGGE